MGHLRVFVWPLLLATATVSSVLATPAAAQFALDIRVSLAPPPLPIYVQPPLPAPDYIWTPGYWAWDPGFDDYYWVPGTWIRPPRIGYLWTPNWWGWDNGVYLFHRGYWGQRVGWYGGVSYGFGYTGNGFFGGRWDGGHFSYNQRVNNITNVQVTNVYREDVTVNRVTNVSYNGGPGGVRGEPTPEQRAVETEPRLDPTPEQEHHLAAAQGNRALFAGANHGVPPVAATARPAVFSGPNVARGGRPGEAPPPISGAARPQGFAGGPGQNGRGGADGFHNDARPAGSDRRGGDSYGGGTGRNGGGDPYAGDNPRPGGGNPHPNGGRPTFDSAPRPQGQPHPQPQNQNQLQRPPQPHPQTSRPPQPRPQAPRPPQPHPHPEAHPEGGEHREEHH